MVEVGGYCFRHIFSRDNPNSIPVISSGISGIGLTNQQNCWNPAAYYAGEVASTFVKSPASWKFTMDLKIWI